MQLLVYILLSVQAMLLFLRLLLIVFLCSSLCLLMGITAKEHHGEQGTANLSEQTCSAKHHIGGCNKPSDAKPRNPSVTEIAEEIGNHADTTAQETSKCGADTL